MRNNTAKSKKKGKGEGKKRAVLLESVRERTLSAVEFFKNFCARESGACEGGCENSPKHSDSICEQCVQ